MYDGRESSTLAIQTKSFLDLSKCDMMTKTTFEIICYNMPFNAIVPKHFRWSEGYSQEENISISELNLMNKFFNYAYKLIKKQLFLFD